MRRPVNDPGPVPIAIAQSSEIASPAAARTSSMAPGNAAPCDVPGRSTEAATRPAAITARLAIDVEVSSPRTGRVATACSSSRLTLHNTRDIIEDYKRHQCHEQKQSNLEHRLSIAEFERLALNSLEYEEQQMSAVEQRHRQQIYYAEFEAQHHGEHREVCESAMRLLASHLRDHDWTAQRVFHGSAAGEDTGDSDHHLHGHFDRRFAGLFDGADWAVPLGGFVTVRLHPNHPGGRVGAINGLLIEAGRLDDNRAARGFGIRSLDFKLDRGAVTGLHGPGEIGPGFHRLAVYRDNPIAN